jgi:hypothetical protein
MRDLTRVLLRSLMFIFLLVGCGGNIYYMSSITSDNQYARYNSRTRSTVTYDENGYNEYQQPQSDTISINSDDDEREYIDSRPTRQFYY